MRPALRRPAALRRLACGFSLVELLVALGVAAFIAAAAVPMYADYQANTALRQGGSSLLSEALYAQSEAIKRNARIRLAVTSGSVAVQELATGTTIRTRALPQRISATTASIDFDGSGRPAPFGTSAEVDVSYQSLACNEQQACPRLLIDAGGGVRLCGNKLDCSKL